jgi:hypothetical protein
MASNVTPQQINELVFANLDNPSVILNAAKQYNIDSYEIAKAVGVDVNTVDKYFANAGLTPPDPYLNPYSEQTRRGILNAGLDNIMAIVNSKGNIKDIANLGLKPQIVTSYKDASGNMVTAAPNTYAVSSPDGSGGSLNYFFTVDPSSGATKAIDNPVQNLTYTPGKPGGFFSSGLIKDIVSIGLAYALPIVGEAIAAEIGVGISTGTAIAAIGTGVAQGKTIEQAIESAAPALIAGNIMSGLELDRLTENISNDKRLQNVITNVANSTLKTAIGGGDAKDILTNAIATGGGTLIGETTGQTVGQGLATTIATGDILKGAQAAAGVAGQEEAVRNLVERQVEPIMNAPVSKDVAELNINEAINQSNLTNDEKSFLQNAKQKIFTQSLIAQALPQTAYSSGQLSNIPTYPFAANDPRFLSAIEKNPGLLAKFSEYTNSYAITPDSAAAMNAAYIPLMEQALAKDPNYQPLLDEYKKVTGNDYKVNQVPTPTTQVVTDMGTITIVAPRERVDFSTKPDIAPGVDISVGDVTKPTLSPAIATTTQPLISSAVQPSTATSPEPAPALALSPSVDTKTTSSTPKTPPGPSLPSLPTTTPSDDKTKAPSTITPSTTTTPSVTEVSPISKPVVDTTKDEKKTTDEVKKPTTETPEEPGVTITTSPVKKTPKISAALPTLTGQFASPITQAVSAYRPAGEIESQETGKEKEPVWNVESLRNALGI